MADPTIHADEFNMLSRKCEEFFLKFHACEFPVELPVNFLSNFLFCPFYVSVPVLPERANKLEGAGTRFCTGAPLPAAARSRPQKRGRRDAVSRRRHGSGREVVM